MGRCRRQAAGEGGVLLGVWKGMNRVSPRMHSDVPIMPCASGPFELESWRAAAGTWHGVTLFALFATPQPRACPLLSARTLRTHARARGACTCATHVFSWPRFLRQELIKGPAGRGPAWLEQRRRYRRSGRHLQAGRTPEERRPGTDAISPDWLIGPDGEIWALRQRIERHLHPCCCGIGACSRR